MTEEVHGPETDAAVAKASKSTERKPRRRLEPEPEAAPEIPEVTPEAARGVVYAEALVSHNDARRNSQSVRDVQDALAEADWRVRADPAGYWGDRTARAALEATGQSDPAEVARRLGFQVV